MTESNATTSFDFSESSATEDGQQEYSYPYDDDEMNFRYYNDPWFISPARSFPTELKCFWMCCGLLSTIACYIVLREALQNVSTRGPHRNRAVPYQQATMALAYGIYSFTQLLGPLPGPRQHDDWGPIGTVDTCTAQAFFIAFSLASSSIINASIILMYMLIVRYNWSDDKLLRLLKKINVFALFPSLFLAIAPLSYEGYNYGGFTCLITPLPIRCRSDEDVECLRGQHASHIFSHISRQLDTVIFATCLISIVVNFCLTFFAVKDTEDRSSRYSFRTTASNRDTDEPRVNRAKSLAVFREARLFVCLFGSVLVAYVLYIYVVPGFKFYYFSHSLTVLQGFFVGVIFMKRRPNMKTSEGRVFRRIVWFLFACEPVRRWVIDPVSSALKRSKERRKNKEQRAISAPSTGDGDTTEHIAGTSRTCEDPTGGSNHGHDTHTREVRLASKETDFDTSHNPTGLLSSNENCPCESGNSNAHVVGETPPEPCGDEFPLASDCIGAEKEVLSEGNDDSVSSC